MLCGGRSQRLLDTLARVCQELDCKLEQISQAEGPDVILVTVPSNSVGEQLAQQVGLKSQPDAAECLVEMLPEISDYLSLCSYELAPRGYKTEQYDTEHLRWIEVEEDAQPGFYRYTHYRREYRLKLNDTSLQAPPYIGIFSWLRQEKRIVFEYDPDAQTLTGPASAILSPLFGRAAVLSSGFLPRFKAQTYQHVYRDVPPGVCPTHLLQKITSGRECMKDPYSLFEETESDTISCTLIAGLPCAIRHWRLNDRRSWILMANYTGNRLSRLCRLMRMQILVLQKRWPGLDCLKNWLLLPDWDYSNFRVFSSINMTRLLLINRVNK